MKMKLGNSNKESVSKECFSMEKIHSNPYLSFFLNAYPNCLLNMSMSTLSLPRSSDLWGISNEKIYNLQKKGSDSGMSAVSLVIKSAKE